MPRADDIDDESVPQPLSSSWRCIGGGWALALRGLRLTSTLSGLQRAIDFCAPELAARMDEAPDMYDGCGPSLSLPTSDTTRDSAPGRRAAYALSVSQFWLVSTSSGQLVLVLFPAMFGGTDEIGKEKEGRLTTQTVLRVWLASCAEKP